MKKVFAETTQATNPAGKAIAKYGSAFAGDKGRGPANQKARKATKLVNTNGIVRNKK